MPRLKAGRALGILAIALPIVLVALSRVLLYFHDGYATGLDGYFYALQAKTLLEAGRPAYPDFSLLYPLLKAICVLAGGDPIVGCKIAGILAAVIATSAFVLALRLLRMRPLGTLAAACYFALSPAHLYLSLDFLKNAWGFAALSCFIAALCGISAYRGSDKKSRGRSAFIASVAAAAVLLPISFAFHRLAGLLGTAIAAGVWFFSSRSKTRLVIAVSVAALGGGLVAALAAGLSIGPFVPGDLERMFLEVSPRGPADRLKGILSSTATLREKIELVALHLVPLGLALLAIFGKVSRNRRALLWTLCATSAFLTFPFLAWSFDSISFRLLLSAWIPASFLIAEILDRADLSHSRISPFAGAAIPLASAIAFAAPIVADAEALHKPGRYPNYAECELAFRDLKRLVPEGMRIIASRGIAPFIMFTHGIPAEIFAPPENAIARRYRLAYGFSPLVFERYRAEGEAGAVALTSSYTLLPETLWKRFYEDRSPGSVFLKKSVNPWEPIPPYAVYLDESLIPPAYR